MTNIHYIIFYPISKKQIKIILEIFIAYFITDNYYYNNYFTIVLGKKNSVYTFICKYMLHYKSIAKMQNFLVIND